MRRRLFVSLALLAVALAAGGIYLTRPTPLPPPPAVSLATAPKLFRSPEVNCAMIADAVNHFVALGKSDGLAELRGLASIRNSAGDVDGFERFGYVCRILFLPKGSEPLREPAFGALDNLPYKTMPEKDWPSFPLASSGSCYFVLSDRYTLGGLREDPLHYIDDCEQNGTYRTTKVPVPSRAEALKDAKGLRNSPAWKAAKWPEVWEENTWMAIQRQAELTPP